MKRFTFNKPAQNDVLLDQGKQKLSLQQGLVLTVGHQPFFNLDFVSSIRFKPYYKETLLRVHKTDQIELVVNQMHPSDSSYHVPSFVMSVEEAKALYMQLFDTFFADIPLDEVKKHVELGIFPLFWDGKITAWQPFERKDVKVMPKTYFQKSW